MIKIIIIAWIIFLIVRLLRASFRQRFTPYQPRPSLDAVETIKCPRCGTYVAEGVEHDCQPV
jgi:hypothetical protein